jgi:hypothetical protein
MSFDSLCRAAYTAKYLLKTPCSVSDIPKGQFNVYVHRAAGVYLTMWVRMTRRLVQRLVEQAAEERRQLSRS